MKEYKLALPLIQKVRDRENEGGFSSKKFHKINFANKMKTEETKRTILLKELKDNPE